MCVCIHRERERNRWGEYTNMIQREREVCRSWGVMGRKVSQAARQPGSQAARQPSRQGEGEGEGEVTRAWKEREIETGRERERERDSE